MTATHLEYLESINVKNPDAEFFMWFLDGFIYGLEEAKVGGGMEDVCI